MLQQRVQTKRNRMLKKMLEKRMLKKVIAKMNPRWISWSGFRYSKERPLCARSGKSRGIS